MEKCDQTWSGDRERVNESIRVNLASTRVAFGEYLQGVFNRRKAVFHFDFAEDDKIEQIVDFKKCQKRVKVQNANKIPKVAKLSGVKIAPKNECVTSAERVDKSRTKTKVTFSQYLLGTLSQRKAALNFDFVQDDEIEEVVDFKKCQKRVKSQKSSPKSKLVKWDVKPSEIAPECDCVTSGERVTNEPYYVHLGHAKSLPELVKLMEDRCSVAGEALRVEVAKFCPKNAKSYLNCPEANQVLKRESPNEKVLVLAKQRNGHFCEFSWMVVAILIWDGISRQIGDATYAQLSEILPKFAEPLGRKCASNSAKNCTCQGVVDKGGATFAFGCNHSIFHLGCKFARGGHTPQNARKFKLGKKQDSLAKKNLLLLHEKAVEECINEFATILGEKLSFVAPAAFRYMTEFENEAEHCRLGKLPGKPFAAVAAVLDYAAHIHQDGYNMENGCCVVLTLTKPEKREQIAQFHVLPCYSLIQKNGYSKDSQGGGGLAFALDHCSVLIEYAKEELHGSTALKNPDRFQPSRIGLVFYQHRQLTFPNHGYERTMKRLEEKKRLADLAKK